MAKANKKRVIDDVDEELSTHEESPKVKKSKGAKSAAGEGVDSEGNRYWELSSKRRIGVSKFKNMHFINIREYFEQNGEMRPGKKGISLSIEQYEALLKALPAINEELRKQGIDMKDPDEEVVAETKKVAKKGKKAPKANIEATSDEESE